MSDVIVHVNVSSAQPIEPGKLYVLECDQALTWEVADQVLRTWRESTGADAVLLVNGIRVAAPETEAGHE